MKRTLIVVKLLVAVLVACVAPIQPSRQTTQPAAPTLTSALPTRAPAPAPTVPKKANPTATPTAELSDAPLESGVLLTRWGLRSGALHAVDPLTGRDLSGYAPIDMGHHFSHAFSPDGKTLAAVRYLGDSGRGGVLHLIDLQAWRDVTTALKFNNWITAMSFSPDGTRLAIAYAGRPTTAHGMPEDYLLVSVDVVEQIAVAQTSFDFAPRVVKYASDGASLMVYGVTYDTNTGLNDVGPPRAMWLDAADLSVEWDVALPDVRDGQFKQKESDGSETYFAWWPAAVPSHDGQALYIVHADEDRLTTVDFANRATRTVAIGPARSWLDRLLAFGAGVAYAKGAADGTIKQAVLSSDGKRLYVIGQTNGTWRDAFGGRRITQMPLGLQVVDAASGVEIAKLETRATEIDLSPDGSRLYLRGGSNMGLPWTDVLNASRLETMARLDGHYVIPARRIGGQPILLASDAEDDTALATLDAQSLRTIHAWSVEGYANWLSVPSWETRAPTETPAEPSAQPAAAPTFASSVLLAQWGTNGRSPKILPVDPATGREAPGYAPIFAWPEALSADGKKLAAIESHGQATESYAGGTSSRPSADVLYVVDVTAWRAVTATLPGKGWVSPITFSPDTTRLALAYHNRTSSTLLLFDADTGQILAQQALAFRPSLMAFTPDGASLVAYGQPLGSPPGMGKPDSPRVLLAEATTLAVMWDQPLEDILSGDWCLEKCSEPHGAQVFAEWRPAVVLSHDGRKLYIVHADEERLTTVDLDARTIQGRGRRPSPNVARSWFERLLALTAGVAEAKGVNTGTTKEAVLSPDGKHLYVVETTRNITHSAESNSEGIETQVGLQVIDVESGHKAASRNIEVTGTWISADKIRFTPDGAYLVVSGWRDGEQWTEVLDAKSLERVARLDGWGISITRGMNGRPIILASQYDRDRTEFAVLDPRSFDITHSWSANRYASWVAAP